MGLTTFPNSVKLLVFLHEVSLSGHSFLILPVRVSKMYLNFR